MKVLIDKYIPYLRGVLEPYAEVEYLEPGEFTPERVKDADALFVRTRTKCNEALLGGSRVRLIATATIGYDHIDTACCERLGIRWTNAPGCNAQAVCDYIEEVLAELATCHLSLVTCHLSLVTCDLPLTIGVVGVGHVGSLVAEMARSKGYEVLVNDPPKGIGVSLDEIAEKCDIITFHTPLTRTGEYATWHLCDEAFLSRCKPGALIINAARGGIADEAALLQSGHPYILDTWEGEPNLNREVLAGAELATQHIAGYSRQGKINATNNCLKALSETFGLPLLEADYRQVPEAGDTAPGWIARLTVTLKKNPDEFEELRETYKLR